MAFRHDKIRGNHPITPKKGIKEVDLNIREKGMNDKITVSVKPNQNKKYKFIVGKGYQYDKNARVQMNIFGRPITEYDTGTVIGKHGEEEFYYDVKNDRTGKIEMFHTSNLLPDKRKNRHLLNNRNELRDYDATLNSAPSHISENVNPLKFNHDWEIINRNSSAVILRNVKKPSITVSKRWNPILSRYMVYANDGIIEIEDKGRFKGNQEESAINALEALMRKYS